jgi:NAD(P)H-dependent FMN reductase
MVTIVSGTNRPGSMTLQLAKVYFELLKEQNEEVALLDLEGKAVWERTGQMLSIEKEYLIPADKFIFVLPEYNSSFPGIVKVMMDNSDIKKCWWYKKAMLTGVSDGRAGNLRGLEHMTSILHYLKVNVIYNKLLLSRITDEIDTNGKLIKPETALAIGGQLSEFLKY